MRASVAPVLEEAAFAAWPAREVVVDEGWRLRYTDGLTRRANSVWTAAATGTDDLSSRIERADRFYADRATAPIFQVSDLSTPAGLDAELERRGYVVDAPVSIRVASASSTARSEVAPHPFEAVLKPRYDDAWLDVTAGSGRFRQKRDVYTGILDRIGSAAVFALAAERGTPVSAALGVVHGAVLGIFNMTTAPEHRRRGAGGLLIRALAEHAMATGADLLYLQVERDNAPALALYDRAGFREAYGYHYRTRPL